MKSSQFFKGFKESFPVFIGYFAVSITLGITASNAGLTLFQSGLMSFLNTTSAGQAAGIQIIHDKGSFVEIALSQITINLRYLLMGTALAMRLKPETSLGKRALMSLGITDEIFGLSISQKGDLDPMYTFGGYCMAMPGWVAGTCLGVAMGNVFSETLIESLSIGIYVMFIAIIVKPAKTNGIYVLIIAASAALSTLMAKFLPAVSSGTRVIILTVAVSSVMALIFPIKEEENE